MKPFRFHQAQPKVHLYHRPSGRVTKQVYNTQPGPVTHLKPSDRKEKPNK